MRRRPGDESVRLVAGGPLDRATAAIAATVSEPDAPSGRLTVGFAAGILAVVTSIVGLRILNNLPGAMPSDLALAFSWLTTTGPSVVAVLCVLVGVTHERAWPRVGLVFAGVFGLLGLHVPVAMLPALVAVIAGTGVAVADRGVVRGWTSRASVAAVAWLGLGLSLASATGVLAGVRPIASMIALVAIAVLPAAVRPPWWAWVAGALAAVAVLWVGSVSPFVTGAVVLVAFGVVGAPVLAVAAAAGGGLAGLTGAISRNTTADVVTRWPDAIAAGLLVAAGVPATIPRALAAGVGIALLVGGDPR